MLPFNFKNFIKVAICQEKNITIQQKQIQAGVSHYISIMIYKRWINDTHRDINGLPTPSKHCVTYQLAGWLTSKVIQYLYGNHFFSCINSHCIQLIRNLRKACFQQFPLPPKQMSDISGFPSPAHEANRRITLPVFLTNVRYIKNSTPQTRVTQVHV